MALNRPTGSNLAMLALGVVGDTLASPTRQPSALADGIHLRWAFPRELGFPWYGFYLFRRPTPDGTRTCVAQQLIAQGRTPGSVGATTLSTPTGTLSSDQNLVLTELFAPSGSVEVDLSGRSFISFESAGGNTWRRVDVTLGFALDFPSGSGGPTGTIPGGLGGPGGPTGPGGSGFPGGGGPGGPFGGPGGGLGPGGPGGGGPGTGGPGSGGPGSGGPGTGGTGVGGPNGSNLGAGGSRIEVCGCDCGPSGESVVQPIVESVVPLGNGTYSATFGYNNSSSTAITIPVGPQNGFSPDPAGRGQPTLFLPGRHRNVFTVIFSGAPITWSLGGAVLVVSSATSGMVGAASGIVVTAYLGGIAVARTVLAGGAGSVVTASLVFEAIDEVRITSGPAVVLDLCTIETSDALGQGWVPVPNLQQPICLPARHPDYPCNQGAVDKNASRTLAFSRLSYGTTADWSGANAFAFDSFYDAAIEIVTGGPGKGITDRVTQITAPFDPNDPDATPPSIDESSLDVLLGASVNPAVAQMLGLYWVDAATVVGQSYDYLLVADYQNTGHGDITVIQALVAVANFGQLTGYLKSGVRRSVARPLSPPASVVGYSLPVGAIPPSGPLDAAGQVGLRWDVPTADADKIASDSPVLFHVWRKDYGSGEPVSAVASGAHLPVTDSPLAPGRLRTAAPNPVLPGWPSTGMFGVDGPLLDGWYGYRVSGIDIFGRHSALSDPARWLAVEDDAELSRVAVHVRDLTPPPPPARVQAWAQDPADQFLTKDTAYHAQPTPFGTVVGLRVSWLWTGKQMRQAPDLREFRVYLNPGATLAAPAEPASWSQRIAIVGASEHIVSELVNARLTADGDPLIGNAAQASGTVVLLDGSLALDGIPVDALDLELTDAVGGPARFRVLALDPALRVLALDGTPNLTGTSRWILGERERRYELFLPNHDSNLNLAFQLPLVPTLANPIQYGLVGVSAADDKVASADARITGALGGRYGNEGAVGGPITIYTVWRTLPGPAPLPPFPTDRLLATRADFYSRSFFTLHWSKQDNLLTHVFRAVDATLFAFDAGKRFAIPRTASAASSVSAASLGWTQARWNTVAAAVDALASSAGYAGLSDDGLRLLASLPSNQGAFTRLTREPLDPTDAANADRVGRNDNPALYSPAPDRGAFDDTLDGRAINRYFYRTSAIDKAQNPGPLGVATPPVYLPRTALPAAPIITALEAGDRSIRVNWQAVPQPPSYRVYRASSEAQSHDLRSMTRVATPAGSETSFMDTGLVGLQSYFYRVTAVDTSGLESEPSAVAQGRAFRLAPPDAPAISGLTVRSGPSVRVTWSTSEPLQVMVQRSVVGDSVWRSVSEWLDAASFDDSVESGASYEYRLRARDGGRVQSDYSESRLIAVP
jgi:hypothetical protein